MHGLLHSLPSLSLLQQLALHSVSLPLQSGGVSLCILCSHLCRGDSKKKCNVKRFKSLF